MANGIGATGVVRVGEIQPSRFEPFLDVRKIGGGADFTEAQDIRGMAREYLDDGLFLAFWLRFAFDGLAVDVAIFRQPVFQIVGDEGESV